MADYNLIRTMKAMPIGSVMPWTGQLTQIPKGWLLCNGSELSASDYPLLSRVLRDSYGGGNFGGEFPNYQGTFRLPGINQKCLADITLDHFNSDSNLRPASIDDVAAAEVVGQYIGTEGDLGPPSTFFATTDLNFVYTPDPSGFISSYTFNGVAPASTSIVIYRNIPGTGGTGTDALFTVVKNTDQTYSVSVTQKGKNYTQNDVITISYLLIGGTSSANDITVTVNSVGNSYFSGSITGQTFIGGFDVRSVFVVPRKLGRDHFPQHFHPGQYETINKNDSGSVPGNGVGVWDNPEITVIQTYQQTNGRPNNRTCANGSNGSVVSSGVGNYWNPYTNTFATNIDKTISPDPPNPTVTVGSSGSPFAAGTGRYALAAIGGSKPVKTHTPITTASAAHGVGKAWFTNAKRLRTSLEPSENTALTNLRETGKIDVNTILPYADDTSLIAQPNYDSGTGGSDQQINYKEVLFNSAANSFTKTLRNNVNLAVNDVIESHDHEGEFNIIYDPGSLNIRDFLSVNAQPNVVPESIPEALQIAFTLSSPSLAIINLIRAY